MAFQARHRWMIERIQLGFNFESETQVENLLKLNNCMEDINAFFTTKTIEKIYLYYQGLTPRDRSENDEQSSQQHNRELFVTDGEDVPLLENAIYFLKVDSNVAIDAAVRCDKNLLFGTINASILESMEVLVSQLYQPLVEGRSIDEWGHASTAASREYLNTMQGFVSNLQENLKSMNSGLELKKTDKKYDTLDSRLWNKYATDNESVGHFYAVLQTWCSQVSSFLDESQTYQQQRWESTDAGPDTELEYWKRRLQRLTGIMEQIKMKDCKMIIATLTNVTKQTSTPPGIEKQSIFVLLRNWKQIDIRLTEAANEAKDNVKYLATLEKFIEPLYSTKNSFQDVIDGLPALLNAVKMIHTIARYYNTNERMTKLFSKITNQMVALCKNRLIQGTYQASSMSSEKIWVRNPDVLMNELELCLKLNESYQEQYRLTKDKLLTMPKGKQFDFNETQIFGKFDLFCRRILKLSDMFSTIKQFTALAENSFEGIEVLTRAFNRILDEFKSCKHDLLDYHNNQFDRDYVAFNVRICDLEASLQQYINMSFESISSIEQSLQLLRQFNSILQRENLKTDLESKVALIFHNYGLDLSSVQEQYENFRHGPPLARNVTPVAGNIQWSRHLLRRIEDPMQHFKTNPKVLATKEAKKIIRMYNKVAKTLVAFEYLWYEAWCKSIDKAKAGLNATLIIRHPETKALYVNFDKEIVQLIHEAKALDRIGIDIPESAKLVLLQEEKFKTYFNELSYALKEYDRVTSKIIPMTASLLEPHLLDLEHKIRPGMITLTWTSMNIDAYKTNLHTGLQNLEELINAINDIIENRIELNLKVISQSVLVNLPTDEAFALDEFVKMQEKHVAAMIAKLSAKNTQVELALEDVMDLICNYQFDIDQSVSDQQCEKLREHYKHLMYRALLNATMQSLTLIKKRVCSKAGGTGFLFVERPFFEVDVQLSVPSVRLSPTLHDIQRAINRSAVAVLKCSKHVYRWGQQDMEDNTPQKQSYFEILGCDLEIIKNLILLTGALHGTKKQVYEYLATFQKYDWLWKDDKEQRYTAFISSKPSLAEFESELQYFMNIESEINQIPPVHNISALSLNTKNLKLQLRNECRQWKVQYSDRVNEQAKAALSELTQYIKTTTTKLGREVTSLDSLRATMQVLKEVRERESSIELEITSILDMYTMLESYLPGGYMDKDEMDEKSVMRNSWRKLVDYAEDVTDDLSEIQGTFKRELLCNVKNLNQDSIMFRLDYQRNGPMVAGISPTIALERLQQYNAELDIRDRKVEAFHAGEELFGMRKTEYPELTKTKKELDLLGQLYGLYMDVTNKIEQYNQIVWNFLGSRIEKMSECMDVFDSRFKKLPSRLSEWEAYHLLRKDISQFSLLLPILKDLTKPCIKPRHWEQLKELLDLSTSPLSNSSFALSNLVKSPIYENKDSIESICDSAEKQLQIECKLCDVTEQWATEKFQFSIWRVKGDVLVLKHYGTIIEDLEEAQLQLQTLLAMRHAGPFKDKVQEKLSELSDTADTLELWLKVQTLWMSLESVFTGGDIAKQMPLEAKKFAKIDKNWIKLISKASTVVYVVPCCSNEVLRNTLPMLYGELEKCQKSLEGYLEQKRKLFPRFYFVSNPVLLQILSRGGSDPNAMQNYFEKVFDAVDSVEMVQDENERQSSDSLTLKIVALISLVGGAEKECIPLLKPVLTVGNIEEWLQKLELHMKSTMHGLCKDAASACIALPIPEFVKKRCSQTSLLGLQIYWTTRCTEAIMQCAKSKTILQEMLKEQTHVLGDLAAWCVGDASTNSLSVMETIKMEALITVQVHQRDCFAAICSLYKDRKFTDITDFEWLKQARFYWRKAQSASKDSCIISICDIDFSYEYEYLGCKERLVITPLTDRAYITLSQALGMSLGGAPSGPAGTGKTETVKDLGRSLGIFVVVTNCTDQHRYKDMAKIFKGLCQGGLWGCFDEFNRIELPVLSVVAQQVLAITSAKRTHQSTFNFPGEPFPIPLARSVGYFITMNPTYQGRQELPENLKILFRSVTMMVPDREIIMKVKLCAVGYLNFALLARKFKTLYQLCELQLSNQRHYDFGLRNILSVLRAAGALRRKHCATGKSLKEKMLKMEEAMFSTTLRDMNLSKLVAEDIPLFLSLLKDLFPNVINIAPATDEKSARQDATINIALDASITALGKAKDVNWCRKCVQLNETVSVRHGIMLVGPTAVGKSELVRVLQHALSSTTNIPHKQIRMNPKAIRVEDMFGEVDRLSGEWVDGVFAAMWFKFNDRNRKDINWIICDGPVDAIWIENLNTVLDDNKLLTLANGDRIPMSENCKLLFEVENLRNASPATVSRTGIIYISVSDLSWEAVFKSYLLSMQRSPEQIQFVSNSVQNLVNSVDSRPTLWKFLQLNCQSMKATQIIPVFESMLKILSSILTTSEVSDSADDAEHEIDRLVLFAVTWSFGNNLNFHDRKVFGQELDERCKNYPVQSSGNGSSRPTESDTVPAFEYFVNADTLEWEHWMTGHGDLTFQVGNPVNLRNVLVPTVQTSSAVYLLRALQEQHSSCLLTGASGTGKSVVTSMFRTSVEAALTRTGHKHRYKGIHFTSITTPGTFQFLVESEIEKRGGKSYGPSVGQLSIVVEDINLPLKNDWGDQPTLEIVRQLIETSGFCFLEKDKRGDIKTIEDVSYIATMGPSSSACGVLPNRLLRHFVEIHMISHDINSIHAVYGKVLCNFFEKELTVMEAIITCVLNASQEYVDWICHAMLPTPSKLHYQFSYHDVARALEGLLRMPASSLATSIPYHFVSLPAKHHVALRWKYEMERSFIDKLSNVEDKSTAKAKLSAIMQIKFNLQGNVAATKAIMDDSKCCMFLGFRSSQADENPNDKLSHDIYPCCDDVEKAKSKIVQKVCRHNENCSSGLNQINMVLFIDAVTYVIKICRILTSPSGGNLMLVGVGGSGKQSLTKLACLMVDFEIYRIKLHKAYNLASFLDDLRLLYRKVASGSYLNKNITFLLTEADIKEEAYLACINSFLLNGEISQLFTKDELAMLVVELKEDMKKNGEQSADLSNDAIIEQFYRRAQLQLHVVLSFSPVHEKYNERCINFPGLLRHCQYISFLPWPLEALVAVAEDSILEYNLDASESIKRELIQHMGYVHNGLREISEELWHFTRKKVYQTPKAFLLFVSMFQSLYRSKWDQLDKQERDILNGLSKLMQGAKDVEDMKLILSKDEIKFKEAEQATNEMLQSLQVKSMDAKKENDIVVECKRKCELDAADIGKEKLAAEEDLAAAQPYLEEAERAVSSIKPNDLNELKKLAKPADIIKLIFDCVGILRKQPLAKVEKVSVTLGIGKEKHTMPFISDSYTLIRTGMLSDARFLQHIFHFSQHEKDEINDETIELMLPYTELPEFCAAAAKNASRAAEGLCCWVNSMVMYHDASKTVKPKLEALRVAQGRLESAQADMSVAESKLLTCQEILNTLQDDFEHRMAEKSKIELKTIQTRSKMQRATSLINGLSSERKRWSEDSKKFASQKQNLVGDIALCSAFLSYCGPFPKAFRSKMLRENFVSDLSNRQIPTTARMRIKNDANKFNPASFLVNDGTRSDWHVQGLPNDSFSEQNGTLCVLQAPFRPPLLVDPQGQGYVWIAAQSKEFSPPFGPCNAATPKLKERLELCLSEGYSMLLFDVLEHLDNMVLQVLSKDFVHRGNSKYITLGDQLCEYNDKFRLVMTTKLSNPHYAPEIQALTTIIDFTVTEVGLEEQLLGIVIQSEQKQLEDQLITVRLEINENTKSLIHLDHLLLERLTASEGNLLDDIELITVLADTKSKATEVNEKLRAAEELTKGIYEKREQYRPVASRGSILYFCVDDMANVSPMYQTSLDQFTSIFRKSIELAESAAISLKRVYNILQSLTFRVFRHVSRGLYEEDKLGFTVKMALNILKSNNLLDSSDISLFLKAGSTLDIARVPAKPCAWLQDGAWLNLVQIANSEAFFRDIIDVISKNGAEWKKWYESNEPELLPLPHYEGKLNIGAPQQCSVSLICTMKSSSMANDEADCTYRCASYLRILLIRCMREDRLVLALDSFLQSLEIVSYPGSGNLIFPGIGPDSLDALKCTAKFESIHEELSCHTPVIFLLSRGSDPSDSIETFARKHRIQFQSLSMGEGQEASIMSALQIAMTQGSWLFIQNGHLGLSLMRDIDSILRSTINNCHVDFRLFITSDPCDGFPISLLQSSFKVTNDPPSGLKAGVLRSLSVCIDQDRLDRIESTDWRFLLFNLCFLHSVVQERKKFGSIGWSVPYEFNYSDLDASINFLEKHMYSSKLSWDTVRYMVGEVQYGGKITDGFDRRLFQAYMNLWFTADALNEKFVLNKHADCEESTFSYLAFESQDASNYVEFVKRFPGTEMPSVFGLHKNADLTYRFKESQRLLKKIVGSQSSGATLEKGKTREDIVIEVISELEQKLPSHFSLPDVESKVKTNFSDSSGPMNVFLYQEISQFENILDRVSSSLAQARKSIHGELVMTPKISCMIQSIYNAEVPSLWLYSNGNTDGDEISWFESNLSTWMSVFQRRYQQLLDWYSMGSPPAYWLAGFHNPQGFLTAMRQEVVRLHEEEKWSLDEMVYHSEVTEFESVQHISKPPREGVYLYDLYLDGAAWDSNGAYLIDSIPKELYHKMPVIFFTAVTKDEYKKRVTNAGANGLYACPCYQYANRTMKNYLCSINLPISKHPVSHWILRGTAVLLNTSQI